MASGGDVALLVEEAQGPLERVTRTVGVAGLSLDHCPREQGSPAVVDVIRGVVEI